jgi:hypothetical protein
MSHMRFWKVAVQIAGFLVFIACFASPSGAAPVPGCSPIVTPNAAIFGPQTVGTSSAVLTLTFSVPTDTASCTLTGFAVGGADLSEFSATGNGGTPCTQTSVISGGGSCTVGTTFTPAVTGMRTATLTFSYTTGGGSTSVNLVGGDEVVYVSTQGGGQILKVDGSTGAVAVVSGDPGVSINGFSPEGMTVGPDGKIYISLPSTGQLVRMNQDGTQPELIYDYTFFFDAVTTPGAPQGPSFSSSSTGDLYFNSTTSSNGYDRGVFVITGVGTKPYPYTQVDPAHVAPTIDTSFQTCISFCPQAAGGTAFDSADNLLFAEQAGGTNPNSVLRVSPPYTPTDTPATVVSGLNHPIGVALNKSTGQMFVADTNASGFGEILLINSPGPGTTIYYTFGQNGNSGGCMTLNDIPTFMQSDGTGNLYVVTSTDPTGISANTCGKVWRIIPPCDCSRATLLLDLQVAYTGGGSVLNSPQAIGLAMQTSGTQGQTQSPAGGVSPTGGSFTLGWPVPCIPANDGSAGTCSYTYGLTYGNNMFQPGDIVKVTPTETSQADWGKRTTGNGFAPSHLAEVLGYGGDGFIISVSCTTSANAPCTFPPNNYYTTTSAWKSPDPVGNWCTFGGAGKTNPQLLKADPIGSNNWIGILIACEDNGPKHIGGSGPGLSDDANVKGATGTAPTITITTPANGANYNQNSIVDANYSCTPTPPVVTGDCFGGPDLVNGTTNVQNNTPIDTSTLGMHQFQVSADVSSGPSALTPGPTLAGFPTVLFPTTVIYTVVPAAQMSATPANVYFGTFHVPGFGFQFVTVKNIGAAPLSISSVKVTSVSGKDSDDFFALSLCPRTLGAGKSCFILLGFFADEVTANNPQMANLVITATGGSVVVPLSATVVKR